MAMFFQAVFSHGETEAHLQFAKMYSKNLFPSPCTAIFLDPYANFYASTKCRKVCYLIFAPFGSLNEFSRCILKRAGCIKDDALVRDFWICARVSCSLKILFVDN